jgi:hypothetical protein
MSSRSTVTLPTMGGDDCDGFVEHCHLHARGIERLRVLVLRWRHGADELDLVAHDHLLPVRIFGRFGARDHDDGRAERLHVAAAPARATGPALAASSTGVGAARARGTGLADRGLVASPTGHQAQRRDQPQRKISIQWAEPWARGPIVTGSSNLNKNGVRFRTIR